MNTLARIANTLLGSLSGVTAGVWLRMLRENRFAVAPRYWLRALTTTAVSLPNSVGASAEGVIYNRPVEATPIRPPLFLLGIFRSGTTFLHQLMAQDHRFAVANHYETTFPHHFLLTQPLLSRLLEFLVPTARPQDNVALNFRTPHEDEFAMMALTGRTFIGDLMFSRRADDYRRYYLLDSLSRDEMREWEASITWFFKKLTYLYQRRLLLKSPGHTCRIKHLLRLFPEAKFVHISRDPFAVFQSWRKLVRATAPALAFQNDDFADLDETILRTYKLVYQAFFEQRSLIAPGRIVELRYEDFIVDPISRLRQVYESLDLPDFEAVRPAFEAYTTATSSYRRNSYAPLTTELRERIADEWQFCFDRWGYSTTHMQNRSVA